MAAAETSSFISTRRRRITIIVGIITVVAIVFGFAGDYLGLPWKGLRPAAELLLLAELVGLVVLERHQLFEPVHELATGIDTRVADMSATLHQLSERLNSLGQVSVAMGARESFQLRTRLVREATTREQETPQILRSALLSGAMVTQDTRDLGDEQRAFLNIVSESFLLPDSPRNSKGHRWSIRLIFACATTEAIDQIAESIQTIFEKSAVLNVEIKVPVKGSPERSLSPNMITDRAVFLVYSDEGGPFRWGLALHGHQYAGLFAQWFDDLWFSIPENCLVYSRSGLNQKAIDRIRKELSALEVSGGARRIA